MRRSLAVLFLTAAGAALDSGARAGEAAAAAVVWGSFGADQGDSAQGTVRGPAAPPDGANWTTTWLGTAANGTYCSNPVLDASARTFVLCAGYGTTQWTTPPCITAWDGTGSVLWSACYAERYPAGYSAQLWTWQLDLTSTGLLVFSTDVWVGSNVDHVSTRAVRAADGSEAWLYKAPCASLFDQVMASRAMTDGSTVALLALDGTVTLLDGASGRKSGTVALMKKSSDFWRLTYFSVPRGVVGSQQVSVASSVFAKPELGAALNDASGGGAAVAWTNFTSPAPGKVRSVAWGPVVATVDDSRRTGAVGAVRTLVVYAALPRSGVVLDAATGEVLWADELPFSAPLVPADNGQMTAVCSAGYAFIVSATYSTKPAAPGPIFVSVYDVGAPAVALVANFSYAVGGSVVSNVAVSPACDSLYVLYESYMTGGAIGNFLSLLSFDASTGAVAERHTQLIPELPAWGGSAFHLALGPRPGQAVISSRPSGQSPAVVALSEAAALVE